MRNFVECCLGGDPILPDMTLSLRESAWKPGDVLLVCTDGMWGSLRRRGDRERAFTARTALRDALATRWASAPCTRRRRQRQHLRGVRWMGNDMTGTAERTRAR